MPDRVGWYVLQVMTGTEHKVARRIAERTGEKALVPTQELHERHKGQWTLKKRVIIQGYVFIQANVSAETYYIIRAINGVIRFLGDGRPVTVPDEQMEIVQALGNGGQPLECSITEKKDGRVRILSGPLKPLEDRIIKADMRARRATITIPILDETKTLSMGICSRSDLAGEASPQESEGEQTDTQGAQAESANGEA